MSRWRFPAAVGVTAALALMAFYLAIVALAEGRPAARQQLVEDAPYLAFLFPGFGLQAAVFTHVRRLATSVAAAGAVAGASGGVSATAVVACCAHFIPTLLPVVGISAASSLLAAWKGPLLLLAIAANLAGVAYMVSMLRKHASMLGRAP